MKFEKSNQYNETFVKQRMMGPNAMKMMEALTSRLPLSPGMRVLDLGCGMGLTSIFLAREYGLQVFATDLWIDATTNYKTFLEAGVDAIPIHADALNLPYADGFFDAAFSIDSYHYYGREASFMEKKLAPLVKPGGIIALTFPGLKKELSAVPKEFEPGWGMEEMQTMHSIPWWKELFGQVRSIKVDHIEEMPDFDEYWQDWLACTHNEYAVGDKAMMDQGAGKHMNLIEVIAHKK